MTRFILWLHDLLCRLGYHEEKDVTNEQAQLRYSWSARYRTIQCQRCFTLIRKPW